MYCVVFCRIKYRMCAYKTKRFCAVLYPLWLLFHRYSVVSFPSYSPSHTLFHSHPIRSLSLSALHENPQIAALEECMTLCVTWRAYRCETFAYHFDDHRCLLSATHSDDLNSTMTTARSHADLYDREWSLR